MRRTMPVVFATLVPLTGLVAGTADDHMTAALLYLQQAKKVQTQAEQFQAMAATIKPIEDPKGIRRGGLMTAAQEKRSDAAQLQQLFAAHYEKAQTMLGKQQPQ